MSELNECTCIDCGGISNTWVCDPCQVRRDKKYIPAVPNMDEVVRQEVIDKAKLLGYLENELRTYKELGSAFDERRHELFALRHEITEGKFDSDSNRLLIEERESHGPEGRNYTNAQYVELRLKLEQESIKVAEQDKKIQRLQKFEDTLKLFKLNGASDIYGWLEEQGIDI